MNPVGWFEIYVKDINRAKAFYEQTLDIKLTKIPTPDIEMWSFPSNGNQNGATGSLVAVPGYHPTGSAVLLYFSCEDCAVEASRVENAGGKIQRPKMQIGDYGFVTLVLDTEGNMIGLHSQK